MPKLFWTIDSLVIKDNVLFGFGWIFHARHEIVSLRFRLASTQKGIPEYIYADYGKPREDVGRAYRDHERALNSGYVVFGALSDARDLDSILLECALGDGSIMELSVPPAKVTRFSNDSANNNSHVLRQAGTLFNRGLHLIRAGKFSSLVDKARRYIKGRPQTALQRPDDLTALFGRQEGKKLCLILDHDLGGGANHYRDRLVNSLIHEGRGVIILTFHVTTLSYMVIVRDMRLNLRYSIPDLAFLLEALEQLSVGDIIYNTAVSFVKPTEIPQFLIRLKALTSARIRVLAHDFYLVCPSHFLLDHEGKYCKPPTLPH